jgi:serine/threonine-protein phosphatase 5
VFLCNRSFAALKLENFGNALSDAEEAISYDPQFPKGYYRKSAALFALGKIEDAIQPL